MNAHYTPAMCRQTLFQNQWGDLGIRYLNTDWRPGPNATTIVLGCATQEDLLDAGWVPAPMTGSDWLPVAEASEDAALPTIVTPIDTITHEAARFLLAQGAVAMYQVEAITEETGDWQPLETGLLADDIYPPHHLLQRHIGCNPMRDVGRLRVLVVKDGETQEFVLTPSEAAEIAAMRYLELLNGLGEAETHLRGVVREGMGNLGLSAEQVREMLLPLESAAEYLVERPQEVGNRVDQWIRVEEERKAQRARVKRLAPRVRGTLAGIVSSTKNIKNIKVEIIDVDTVRVAVRGVAPSLYDSLPPHEDVGRRADEVDAALRADGYTFDRREYEKEKVVVFEVKA